MSVQAQQITDSPKLTACDHRSLSLGDITALTPELASAERHAMAAGDCDEAHQLRQARILVDRARDGIAARARERCL